MQLQPSLSSGASLLSGPNSIHAYSVLFLPQPWKQLFLQGALGPFTEDWHLETKIWCNYYYYLMIKNMLMSKIPVV